MSNLAYLIETTEVEQEGFVINDDQKAEWAIRAIKEEESESKRLIDLCNAQIDFYAQRIHQYEEDLERRTCFLKTQLADYFEQAPKKATKTQETVTFPSGKLVRKFPRPEYVRDNDKLIRELDGSDYVDLVPKLKWAALKKDLEILDGVVVNKTTGQVVESITVVERPATFEVK